MGFAGYPHLVLLISGQPFEVTIVQKKFWELNRRQINSRYDLNSHITISALQLGLFLVLAVIYESAP